MAPSFPKDQERRAATRRGTNTLVSVIPGLLVCLAVALLGHLYPALINTQITWIADGGVAMGLVALISRFTLVNGAVGTILATLKSLIRR